MEVQSRISEYIKRMGIKQTTICEKTGIPKDALSTMLSNKRKMSADEFEKICIAIEKAPNDFMLIEQETKGGGT